MSNEIPREIPSENSSENSVAHDANVVGGELFANPELLIDDGDDNKNLSLHFLREGVSAAKQNNKILARTHLLEAVKLDARCETAWLWLASISSAPEDRVSCLQRVLDINSQHERALEWMEAARKNLAQSLLVKGVAAAKSGDRALATNLLQRAAEQDAAKEITWLWLASLAENLEDKLAHLQRVLDLNPANEQAVKGFRQTKNRMARQLLQKGSAAAKAGERELARDILRDVMEYDATIEEAWMLLAEVTDALELKHTYLARAVEVAPQSERAREALDAVDTEIAFQLIAPPADSWTCRLCLTESHEEAHDECTACGAILTLNDIDCVLNNKLSDTATLQSVVGRLRAKLDEGEMSAEENYNLALALLNLGEIDEAIAYFRAALRMNASDETLHERINTLLERRSRRITEQAARQVTKQAELASAPASSAPIASRDEAPHNESSPIAPRVNPAKAMQASGHTIMVVDDSPTIRKLVSIKLEKHGHKVVEAVDGMDALAKLNDCTPDLILLDVTMPRLDGYQLCKLVRGNQTLKDTPVVMLSGKDGFFDKVRGRLAGSTAYITKPFEPDALLQVINEHCRIKVEGRN